VAGQKIIPLTNGSFEDVPKQSQPPRGWGDCGFAGESPTDVHPASDSLSYWQVQQPAAHGNTYLGMVVRDNETYESISQYLPAPIRAGSCYEMTISLCKSKIYISQSRMTGRTENYDEPTVIRIYGGTSICRHSELLYESPPIDNTEWEEFLVEFKPSGDYRTITLEAFYKTPVLFPYNGNLLVDNASDIEKVTCPEDTEDEDLAKNNQNNSQFRDSASSPLKNDPVSKKLAATNDSYKGEYIAPSIMPELQIDKVRKDQTIRVRSLHFDADSTSINEESKQVIDEIFRFLDYYPDVKIEIAGHANLKPKKEYAIDLSQKRAESVSQYLVEKGIDPKRVVPVGYGKTKPIVESVNRIANKLNQRVEIKILETQ
jgi:outer membrane protein OmpA-like peptidoglycan-associated protein